MNLDILDRRCVACIGTQGNLRITEVNYENRQTESLRSLVGGRIMGRLSACNALPIAPVRRLVGHTTYITNTNSDPIGRFCTRPNQHTQ